jgi:High-temperature-induced dauer-formation protein
MALKFNHRLPLDPVMLVISELLPKVQELQAARHKRSTTSSIMDFLSSITLKHVLPPPPPLTPRKFLVDFLIQSLRFVTNADYFQKWTDASIVWLTSLIWGEIFVRAMTPLGIWNSTNVRLFYVKHKQIQQRQLTETVSNVVGGLLGRNVSSDGPQTGRTRGERA